MVIEHSLQPSVGLCVCVSVCLSVQWIVAKRLIGYMDAVWGGIGPGMRQVVGFGDRSTGGSDFWGECGASALL